MSRYWKSGDPFVWVTGGALALTLIMVGGLIVLISVNGLGFFWPKAIYRFDLKDGRILMGQIADREWIPDPDAPPGTPRRSRIKIKQANRDVYGADFVWVDEDQIAGRGKPADAILVERLEWGDLIGTLKAFRIGDEVVAEGQAGVLKVLKRELPLAEERRAAIRRIERKEVGAINTEQERLRLKRKRLDLAGVASGPQVDAIAAEESLLARKYEAVETRLRALRETQRDTLVVSVTGGEDREVPLSDVVRYHFPNAMGFWQKAGYYCARLWEFVSADPRESNTEGGIFPAIFGTVMMVFLMSLMVMPLGILAALYLREYSRQGTFVSIVRIAVNNLAGVPSIVFGVFGVGFFIYFVGGGIDRFFFSEALPTPTFGTGGILWASLTLALLTVPVVIVATEEGLAAIPQGLREGSLALGATKFETTVRVILPSVLPSILTGLILAMARAAGEVAPLMITGVVKLAPTLPLDGHWPFLHLERKFMHLGFHIYDVGFQSPNVDAARPMVFMTAFLLLFIVLALNLTAILLRNRLKKKFAVSAV